MDDRSSPQSLCRLPDLLVSVLYSEAKFLGSASLSTTASGARFDSIFPKKSTSTWPSSPSDVQKSPREKADEPVLGEKASVCHVYGWEALRVGMRERWECCSVWQEEVLK